MSLITCENLALGYEGQTVVSGINFVVNKGDYICIIGENGSGKSTLMKAILGQNKPLKGKITYSDGLKTNKIGYLPQQNLVQRDFPTSVWEVVMSGCLNQCGILPFYTKKQKNYAKSVMEKLGITSLSKRCYRELSGGQQQRVLLARAMCATRDLIVLDEPTSGLDPKVTSELYDIIKQINDDGITVIMVSHDIEASMKYASHILHISHKPLFWGKKSEYFINNNR